MWKTDTIAAVATPPGEGGIAVVRVSGPEARTIAAQMFRPLRGGDPALFPGYSVHYGTFVEEATGEIADDGLLTVFHAPHSYTGEDTLELSCHGGRATTARVLQLVLNAGSRLAEPGEFTQRAFLNGRLDLAQAEAVADVIRARTESARRLARRQLDGALSQAIGREKDALIGILAAIEVTIDFSDEVGELEYAPLGQRLSAVRAGVQTLLQTAERGRILREGLRIAIIGRPNVGKSSLLNGLLRSERAIVTPIAGTTRDLVEESANLAGLPVVLVDTAGIRATEDMVERIGVERAQSAAEASDLLLLVLDATTGVTAEDHAVVQQIASDPRLLIVINKRDAVSESEARAVLETARETIAQREDAFLLVSAQTGEGLEALETAIAARACEPLQSAAGPSAVSPLSEAPLEPVLVSCVRHRQALEEAYRSLLEAERTIAQRLPGDFIAIDVRGALNSLGRITGETVTEDIIHRIFRDFCVGK